MSSPRVDIWLEWTTREPPPTEKYMAVATFDAVPGEMPGTVWSIVLFAPPQGFARKGFAQAAMLVPEASGQLLSEGASFLVMAGRKEVAHGRVEPKTGTLPTTSNKS